MPVPISADEVFEMACQIERNGAAFYRRAAGQTDDGPARIMLEALADMEDEHLETFTAMRAEYAARGGSALQTDGEAAQYLRAMADGRVFDAGDPAGKLTGDEDLADVLRTAVGLEKDSIVFYAGVKEAVGGAAGKKRIDAIIQQELGHIATLNAALAEL